MDFTDKNLSKERQEQYRLVSESVDPSSVSPLQISTSPRSPKSPKSPRSPRSQKGHQGRQGGYGGKGEWGGLMEVEDGHEIDPNDPNYASDEEERKLTPRTGEKFAELKKKATEIVQEYFTSDNVISTTNELPNYHFYFVKKLVSLAMDRCDKEKEMASILLSSLYGDLIDAQQVYKGFYKLVVSADDLIVDIPDAVDILALFVAQAVVDDLLPPSFLTKTICHLSEKVLMS